MFNLALGGQAFKAPDTISILALHKHTYPESAVGMYKASAPPQIPNGVWPSEIVTLIPATG